VICFLKRTGIRNAAAISTSNTIPVIFRVFLRIFFIAMARWFLLYIIANMRLIKLKIP
jgi:hypothetical protein